MMIETRGFAIFDFRFAIVVASLTTTAAATVSDAFWFQVIKIRDLRCERKRSRVSERPLSFEIKPFHAAKRLTGRRPYTTLLAFT
jgi:hypothetical protein